MTATFRLQAASLHQANVDWMSTSSDKCILPGLLSSQLMQFASLKIEITNFPNPGLAWSGFKKKR